jgi:serine/threonine-protein kinase
MKPRIAIGARSGIALLGGWILLVTAAGARPPAGQGPYFPADAPWYQDISTAPVDGESATVISWLSGVGGWGGGHMQIDFSIEVLAADASTPFRSFTPTDDFFDPDCDLAQMPVPPGGALEGESGYQCLGDGDCHLLVVHPPSHKLYEMWRANIDGTNHFFGGCLAVWNLDLTYPYTGRGQDCTSADGAGFPMAPLLFNADEVAAGHVDHAIRFILPNSRIRHLVYVHPATHSTSPTSGPATAPPYGARLRLRANYPLQNLPNEAARVVARAMQKYGILLSDGGTIALTAQNDTFTTAQWSGLLGPNDLSALQVTDFQMIAAGDRYTWTGDCVRTTPLFNDAFETGGTAKWSGLVP